MTYRKNIGDVLLKVESISLSFGAVRALIDVSLEIFEREIFAMIGPNGAGKTTMLNVINGVYHPEQGTITYKGEARKAMRPHHSAAQGISRTFQNAQNWPPNIKHFVLAGIFLNRKRFLFQ